MLCPKCGAAAPEGTSLCSQCGEQLAPQPAPVMDGQSSTPIDSLSAKPEPQCKPCKLGLPLLALLGATALVVGPFLRWVFQSNQVQTLTMQGLYWSPGSALYVLGTLVFVMTIALKDKDRQLSAVLTILGALSLALVCHFAYVVYDEPGLAFGDIREGFYVSAGGAVFTTLAGCPLFRRLMI